jgi:hypothetical protein
MNLVLKLSIRLDHPNHFVILLLLTPNSNLKVILAIDLNLQLRQLLVNFWYVNLVDFLDAILKEVLVDFVEPDGLQLLLFLLTIEKNKLLSLITFDSYYVVTFLDALGGIKVVFSHVKFDVYQ